MATHGHVEEEEEEESEKAAGVQNNCHPHGGCGGGQLSSSRSATVAVMPPAPDHLTLAANAICNGELLNFAGIMLKHSRATEPSRVVVWVAWIDIARDRQGAATGDRARPARDRIDRRACDRLTPLVFNAQGGEGNHPAGVSGDASGCPLRPAAGASAEAGGMPLAQAAGRGTACRGSPAQHATPRAVLFLLAALRCAVRPAGGVVAAVDQRRLLLGARRRDFLRVCFGCTACIGGNLAQPPRFVNASPSQSSGDVARSTCCK
jgi:hypothetical protein